MAAPTCSMRRTWCSFPRLPSCWRCCRSILSAMRCATISTRVRASKRGSSRPEAQPLQKTPHSSLDNNSILQYKYPDLLYEAGRENSLPAGGGRLAARHGPSHDPAGDREGGSARAAQEHQPVVLVADRKRGTPAYDAIVTRAA